MTTSFLRLDGTEQTKKVDEHDTMCELRLIIETVDFTAVFGNSGERKDVIEVET